MSLFGSLYTGVSALSAQSSEMSIISDNIANVNTTGYKGTIGAFQDLVVNTSRSGAYNSGGVTVNQVATNALQGSLTQTSSSLDAAIQGTGYFSVISSATSTNEVYTREGDFQVNNQGYLVNSSGYYLSGYPVTYSAANVPTPTTTLSAVKVSSTAGVTSKTSNVTISANLNAGETQTISAGTQPSNYSRQVTVYDTLGNAETLQLDFYATTSASAAPTWNVVVTPVAAGTSVSTTTATGAVTKSLTFSSTGTLTAVGGSGTSLTLSSINWNNGSGSQSISINLANLTQLGAAYSTTNITQDGTAVGQLSGVSISNSGYVQASYSNGVTKNLYQIPLALFPNQNGLLPQTGNTFAQTVASGAPVLQAAGVGGAGSIISGALESSNVDLATQFTNMIITQRAYSAGTKVISTIDQMLQDLDHIQ